MSNLFHRVVNFSFPFFLFALFLLTSIAPPISVHLLQAQTQPIKTVLTVSVTDKKGVPVRNLPQTAFSITSGKIPLEIVSINNQDTPLCIAILFDLSGSMGGKDGHISKRTRTAVEVLQHFVQTGHRENEYIIIGFNKRPRLLWRAKNAPESVITALDQINSFSFYGDGAVLDAMQLGLEKISRSAYSKQAIIIITDGLDYSSQHTFNDTIDVLKKKNVIVYPILFLLSGSEGLSDSLYREGSYAEYRLMLKEYASLSGGSLFHVKDASEINTRIERIANELRSQYVIEFRLAGAADGKCYPFRIKLLGTDGADNLKSLSVRSREKYCP